MTAPIYVVVMSTGGAGYSSGYDGSPKHPGGPIVMETEVDGNSLERAHARAAMLEKRYGACRIGRVVFEDEPGASGWRPIATAPTEDGAKFLAYFPRHPFDEDDNMDETVDLGGVQVVTWKVGNSWIEPDYLDASGAFFGDDFCYAPVPTHWMPLPADPVRTAP